MKKEELKQTIEELIDNMINKGEYCDVVIAESIPITLTEISHNMLGIGFYCEKINCPNGILKRLCYYYNPPTEEDRQFTQQVIKDYVNKLTLKGSKKLMKYIDKCKRTQFNYGVEEYEEEVEFIGNIAIAEYIINNP